MTLVPTDEGLARRVGPKVFSDVPSQSELVDAKLEAQAAKGRSAWLLIVCVFLAGGFVAAALGLAYVLREDYPAQLEQANQEHAREVARLEANLAQAQQALAPYQGIATDRARVRELRQSIYEMLHGDKQGADNDPSVRRDLATYLAAESWDTAERDSRQKLQTEIAGLERGERRVRAWTPAGGTGPSPFPRNP